MDELTDMEKKNQLVCIMCNDVMMLLYLYYIQECNEIA